MPLWLDLLRTPMAAPETPSLRRLRLSWQTLCLSSATSVAFVKPIRAATGRAGPCFVAALLVATLLVTLVYLTRKHRADSAYLDRLGEEG